jgi:hypothetical protein
VFRIDDAGDVAIGRRGDACRAGRGRVVAATGTARTTGGVVELGAVGTKTVFAKLLEHDAAASDGLN